MFNFHRHIIIYYQSKKMVDTIFVDPITMQRNAGQGSKQRKPCQNSNFGLWWASEYFKLFPALHWLVLKVIKLNYFLGMIDLQQYSLGSITYFNQFLISNFHHLLTCSRLSEQALVQNSLSSISWTVQTEYGFLKPPFPSTPLKSNLCWASDNVRTIYGTIPFENCHPYK